MSIEDSDAPLRIVEAGRRRVLARMRDAFAGQADAHSELGEIDPAVLERLAHEATDHAGTAVWRIALAEGAADEYGVAVSEALAHPSVTAAERLVGPEADEPAPEPFAPAPVEAETDTAPDEPELAEPEPQPDADPDPQPEPPPAGEPQALRIPAVHTSGIDSLEQGDKDLELRLSDAGLDVLRHSTGDAIGRLNWGEITSVEVEAVKRRLPGRKASQTLHVNTAAGQAVFELPGLSDEESAEQLQPMLDRLRDSGMLASAAG